MKPLALAFGILSLGALAACDLPIVDQSGRAAAKAVVGPIVAETVPGQPGVVLTDCIIDHATQDELL